MFLEKTRISLQVTDNGKGFDPTIGEGSTNGKGLKIVNNRVTAFNGHFEIISQPGNGTDCIMGFLIN